MSEKILLVEDDAVDRETIERLLDSRYELHAVESGADMLRFLAKGSPDCVMLDYRLPDYDGLELLPNILLSQPTYPIIMLTGFGNEHTAVHAMKLGASDYLSKNELTRDSLNRAILYSIERKKASLEKDSLERKLLKAQRLESIGRLAGGIAHDFNNLLMVISGYSETAIRKMEPGHPAISCVNEVIQAGQRAANLTRQLLLFSSREVFHHQPINLNDVIINLEKLLKRLIGESIKIVFKHEGEQIIVKSDVSQMEQIITNLVINARDAMPNGGQITIETSVIRIDDIYREKVIGIPKGDYVLLAISDTGCGMDKETEEHIFEPFFTTKEEGKGTGLGLATVYGIVKQSQGEIQVYSEKGMGTIFKIYLPVVNERPLSDGETAVTAEDITGDETILVVEDNESIRKLTKLSLEERGFNVLLASDGKEALDRFSGDLDQIQLLLTDVILPNMNGPDLCLRLREKKADLPVIFMSGYTNDALIAHGIEGKDVGFISKPSTPREIVVKIREVLDNHN